MCSRITHQKKKVQTASDSAKSRLPALMVGWRFSYFILHSFELRSNALAVAVAFFFFLCGCCWVVPVVVLDLADTVNRRRVEFREVRFPHFFSAYFLEHFIDVTFDVPFSLCKIWMHRAAIFNARPDDIDARRSQRALSFHVSHKNVLAAPPFLRVRFLKRALREIPLPEMLSNPNLSAKPFFVSQARKTWQNLSSAFPASCLDRTRRANLNRPRHNRRRISSSNSWKAIRVVPFYSRNFWPICRVVLE